MAVLGVCYAQAQSLRIVDTSDDLTGVVGEQIRSTIKLQNTSSERIEVVASTIKSQIGSSQKSFLCADNDCSEENIVSGDTFIEILPGQTIDVYTTVLETGLVPGVGSLIYRFSNVANPDDYTDLEISISVTERTIEGVLYSSDNLELSDVFPNPVSETAVFNYQLKDNSKEAKIVIHNVLGSVAGEYILSSFENRLKVDMENYNPGVYFYSLYLDNEGVATKKLVVRK